jgi:hypothetical protein
MNGMRCKYLCLAVLVGIIAGVSSLAAAPAANEPSAAATPPVQKTPKSGPGLRDEAAMVIVGTALIGLAAAVRRAA